MAICERCGRTLIAYASVHLPTGIDPKPQPYACPDAECQAHRYALYAAQYLGAWGDFFPARLIAKGAVGDITRRSDLMSYLIQAFKCAYNGDEFHWNEGCEEVIGH